jgi:uncharacterized spore protein YtfJ
MDPTELRQEGDMIATDVLTKVRDAMTVRTAIGDPVIQDGVVVLPAAKIRGGAGGGVGPEDAENSGAGGGFGMTTTPVGAFVIRDGNVTWRPAIDINKVILGGQIVAIVALLTIRSVVRARARR